MKIIAVALTAAIALPALATEPTCRPIDPAELGRRLTRLQAAAREAGAEERMTFARELTALWRLVEQQSPCGEQQDGAQDPMRLTVADGWNIYQAVCPHTLDREVRAHLADLRRELRAGRYEAVRSGVVALAASLASDPQYGECKGLAGRLRRLMSNDLPELMQSAWRSAPLDSQPLTARAR